MNEQLLEQEIENIRLEVVSNFWKEYIGVFIVVCILLFIILTSICPYFLFMFKSIYGIIFIIVLSAILGFYIQVLYSKDKIISKIKNLFLNTGILYENFMISRQKAANEILLYLLELDLDFNNIKFQYAYNLGLTNLNEVIKVGVLFLSNLNYNGYSYQSSDYLPKNLIKVYISKLRMYLLYKILNINHYIFVLIPLSISNLDRIDEKCKVVNDKLIYFMNYDLKDHKKISNISIDIFKKVDKTTVEKIVENSYEEVKEVIKILKDKGLLRGI